MGIWRVEARDAAKDPTMYRTAPHNRTPNVNCAQVEEPCLRASRPHLVL